MTDNREPETESARDKNTNADQQDRGATRGDTPGTGDPSEGAPAGQGQAPHGA